VIPRIQVAGGRVAAVREDGRIVSAGPAKDTIEGALSRWQRAIIADMGGIRGNRPDLQLLKAFEGKPIWVEAGPRTAEAVIDLLVAGAEAVIVGTATIRDMGELRRAHRMTENLLFQLDFQRRLVQPLKGPRRRAANELKEEAAMLGLRGIILMDADGWRSHRDLLGSGETPLYVGLGTERDARDLEDLGVSGVIIPWEEE
jgi:hypothetical protein